MPGAPSIGAYPVFDFQIAMRGRRRQPDVRPWSLL